MASTPSAGSPSTGGSATHRRVSCGICLGPARRHRQDQPFHVGSALSADRQGDARLVRTTSAGLSRRIDGRRVKLSERRFGLRTTLALVQAHPRLVNSKTLGHPVKLLNVLRNTRVSAVTRLLDLVGDEVARGIFSVLLEDLSRRDFFEVVSPLLNDANPIEMSTMAVLLKVLDGKKVVLFATEVPKANISVLLKARGSELVKLLKAVRTDRYMSVIVPVLQEPEEVIYRLLPLLGCRQPEVLGRLINHADPGPMKTILRKLNLETLIDLVNALEPEDFKCDSTLVGLLHAVADDQKFLETKVIPFLQQADPLQYMPLTRRVTSYQLLGLLRRLEVPDVARLLAHTDGDLVVRVVNGAFACCNGAIALAASGLAIVMRSSCAATAVSFTSRQINVGLNKAHVVRHGSKSSIRGCTDGLNLWLKSVGMLCSH